MLEGRGVLEGRGEEEGPGRTEGLAARGGLGFGLRVGAPTTRGLSECKVREWVGEGARAEKERGPKLHYAGGVGVVLGWAGLLVLRRRGEGCGEGGMKSRTRPTCF